MGSGRYRKFASCQNRRQASGRASHKYDVPWSSRDRGGFAQCGERAILRHTAEPCLAYPRGVGTAGHAVGARDAPEAELMSGLAGAVRRADDLRDARRFIEAAEAYRIALAIAPDRKELWVQCGNMLKDSGAYDRAEAAYTEALRLGSDDADCWLQLARAQRLGGRHVEALRSFTEVLRREPGHVDAVRELIDLGAGWQAGQMEAVGTSLLLDVLDATARMRELIDRVEQELPTIGALTTAPLSQYSAVRHMRRVTAPSRPAPGFGLAVIMRGSERLEVMLRVLRALREQTHPALTIAMPDLTGEPARAFARLVACRPERFVHLAPAPPSELAAAMVARPGLVHVHQPVILDREAMAWIAAALSCEATAAVLCDEDVVRFESNRPRYVQPFLRGASDPEMLEQGIDPGCLIGVRTDLALPALHGVVGTRFNLADLVARLSLQGRVDTIPQPLVSRPIEDAESCSAPRFWPAAPRECKGTIAVIVPTRDRSDLVRDAVAAARATARDSARLCFVIVDNGSTDPAMRSYLAEELGIGRLLSLRVDEPFNWSRLNRLGAEVARDADFLVFMNDDVSLTSPAWDDRIADLLTRPEVGVVGARLFYPDGTIQHAGIVATPDGRTAHDGRREPGTAAGPGARYITRRSVTAVTGAFLATRRATFEALGGFDDEALPLWFNDVDFCLKASLAGLRVLYEPAITATHFEGTTLGSSHATADRDALFADAANVMEQRWGDEIRCDRWTRCSLITW